MPAGQRRRIVGVVEDVPFERPHSAPRASVYVPYAQGVVLRSLEAPRAPSIVIRGRGDAAADRHPIARLHGGRVVDENICPAIEESVGHVCNPPIA